MKQILLSLVACIALATGASGQTTADASYGVKYHADQFTIELPHDEDKPYLTIIGHPEDARYHALIRWFDSNDQLRGLKASAHYTELPTTAAMYRERYASTTPALPCVRLQSADGSVMAEYAGRNIPMSAEALTRGIGNCFRQTPDNSPSATPPPPPADHQPYILLAVLIAAGTIAGLVQSFRTRTPKGTK